MSTANVARDMDLLRRAVGDAKLTYAGYSYGSYLGATYANLFPGKVRALVVDGVLDPVAWSTGRGDQARALPFSTRLRSAKAPTSRCWSSSDCATPAARTAPSPRATPSATSGWPSGCSASRWSSPMIRAAPSCSPTPTWWARPWACCTTRPRGPTSPWPAGGVRAGRPGGGRGRLRALRAWRGVLQQEDYPNRRRLPRGRLLRDPQPVQCRRLGQGGQGPGPPVPLLRPALDLDHQRLRAVAGLGRRPLRPWNRATANPVLVVGNLFDPATPYHGAVTVDRLPPRSRLLTLAGWGHLAVRLGHRCPCEPLPAHLSGAGQRHGLRARRCAVRRGGRDRPGAQASGRPARPP